MRAFTQHILNFMSKAGVKKETSGGPVEARLRDGSLHMAWAILASRAINGNVFVSNCFQPASNGKDSSTEAIKLMMAVADKNEARAAQIICRNQIQALIEPDFVADCICAAMRQGLEHVAELIIGSSLNDPALLDGMKMGTGLREALLYSLSHPGRHLEQDVCFRERATPMIEALLHNFEGVAGRLIDAGVGFESPAIGGSFEGTIELLGARDPSLEGLSALHNLAFAIRMRRGGSQLKIIERLRRETPESKAHMVLSDIPLLRLAVASGQERTALALLEDTSQEAAQSRAYQELELAQTQPDSEPTLWLMTHSKMDKAAAKLIEAWSRAGLSGIYAMNRRNAQDSSVLRLAILNMNEPLALMLVSAGADARSLAGKNHPRNMASLAALCGMGGVLDAILTREAGNLGDLLGGGGGETMLKEAIEHKRDGVAVALMKAGAPLPEICKESRSMKALCWSERSESLTAAVMARLELMPVVARKPFLEETHQGCGRLAQALKNGKPERARALLKLGACYDAAMAQLENPELVGLLRKVSDQMNLDLKKHAQSLVKTERQAEDRRIAKLLAEKASAARERLNGAQTVAPDASPPRSIRVEARRFS